MEIKKLSPLAYKLHDFLLQNCVGESRAMKAQELAFVLGLESGTRQLRLLRAEINSSISEIQRKVLTNNSGYFIAAAETPEKAYEQYRQSAWRKIKTGVSMIQEGKRLLESINMDGQVRIDLTGYLKPIVEIYNKIEQPKPRQTLSEIMDELDKIASDPLCIEAMKLYGGTPDKDDEE
jgi:hypothetical protein